jgi:hypothetical protein
LDFDSHPGREAQLFIDTGLGFNDIQSIRKPLTGDEKIIVFDLSNYQDFNQIRFDPIDDMAALHIKEIEIFTIDKRTHKIVNYRSNACFRENNNLIFATNDPQIYLDIKNIGVPQTLIIRLEYISIGPDTNRYILKLKDEEISKKEAELQERDSRIEALNKEISTKEAELQGRDSRIEALNKAASEKEAELQERDSRIEALNKAASEKEAELQKRDSRIEALNKAASEKEAELQKKDSRIEALNKEISSNEAELQEKDLMSADLNKEIITKEAELQKKDSIIDTLNEEKRQQLIKLESLQGQLETERLLKESILNSKSWKFTAPLRWIYNKVKK